MNIIDEFEGLISRLPSMYVFMVKRGNVVCTHGAITRRWKKSMAENIQNSMEYVENGDSDHLTATSEQIHDIEWTDYGDKNSKSSQRSTCRRSAADAFLKKINCCLAVGGHQDRVECVGVLRGSKKKLSTTGKFWKYSPTYEDVKFLIPSPLCKSDYGICELVRRKTALKLHLPVPAIVKTSIAYTGKPSVNGATFLTTARAQKKRHHTSPRVNGRSMVLYAYVVPCRNSTKKDNVTRPSITAKSLLESNMLYWMGMANALPVLYTKDAKAAYDAKELRWLSTRVFREMMEKFRGVQDNCADQVEIVRRDRHHISFIGDIHSNLHALIDVLVEMVDSNILNFSFDVNPEHVVVFLGDYGQRGPYGLLVYALLMRMKIRNKDSVFLTRGNHERRELWESSSYAAHGIMSELRNLWRAENMLLQLPTAS